MHRKIEAARERDAAFIDFVLTGDHRKTIAYCLKYGVTIPEDKKVFSVGIYKAVQSCPDIPEYVKEIAGRKCVELGHWPFMSGVNEWGRYEE